MAGGEPRLLPDLIRYMEIIFLFIVAVMAFGVGLMYAMLAVCLNLIGIPAPCGIKFFPVVFWGFYIFFLVVAAFQKIFGH